MHSILLLGVWVRSYFPPLNWMDSTTLRPKKIRRRATGIIPKTVQAISPVQSGVPAADWFRKELMATAITCTEGLRPIRNGQKNSFHIAMEVKIVRVAKEPVCSGSMILKKMVKIPAPSI
jgi:hypothetical protein